MFLVLSSYFFLPYIPYLKQQSLTVNNKNPITVLYYSISNKKPAAGFVKKDKFTHIIAAS